MPELIERVRVGSHHEYVKWNHETQEEEVISNPEKGYYHRVIDDYRTVYHDCLVSGEWLKAHEHDLDNWEPTIEITVDGGKSLNVNGNYQAGLIKGFMADYITKARIGRKTVNLNVGIADKVEA